MNRLKSLPEKRKPKLIKSLSSFKSLLTWLGIGLLRLSSYLPYSVLMNLGSVVGSLIYKLSPHRREICKINPSGCFFSSAIKLVPSCYTSTIYENSSVNPPVRTTRDPQPPSIVI